MTLNNEGHPAREEIVLKDKVAICRCWQSKRFPFCDGSHHQFNQDNADSVGPIIVKTDE